jgi:hypothetical protein
MWKIKAIGSAFLWSGLMFTSKAQDEYGFSGGLLCILLGAILLLFAWLATPREAKRAHDSAEIQPTQPARKA